MTKHPLHEAEDREFAEWCRDEDEARASLLREFIAANRWTLKKSAAVFGVSAQTVCNWKRTGRYSSAVYRRIYESEWGQERFNPEWPDKFWRCGVGYSDEEKATLGLAPWEVTR